jgi:benzodiazapine receptor
MRSDIQYNNYKKPTWSPPSWLFAPVWTVLYGIIAISYGYVVYAFVHRAMPLFVIVLLVINLISNFSYTFIQFRLKNFLLALIDIVVVLGSLIWFLLAVYPYAHWVSYANFPYLAWVSFATILQISVTWLNRKSNYTDSSKHATVEIT